MKKLLPFVFATVLATGVFAQEVDTTVTSNGYQPTYRVNFFVNPVFFYEGTFMVGYEYFRPDRYLGIVLAGGLTLVDNDKELIKGVRGELRIHHYLNDFDNPKFYVAPVVLYQYAEVDKDPYNLLLEDGQEMFINQTDYITSYGIAGIFGIKTRFLKRGTIETYVGGGIKYSDIKGDESQYGKNPWELGYTGVFPKFGWQLGIFF
ncbi:hypothetical protein JYU20_02865 [Bacteroidales bacterium AH-315-I05]|nr:hypothetical protein [Bacteroidales bacterium AH-315-I05]